jgi:hypothetical protein
MPRTTPFLIGLISAIWAASAAAQAPGAGGFDGTWGVVLACPRSPDGALPFTFRFAADVKGGVLHGQYGTPGAPASLALDGHIQHSGAAQLIGRGITGQSAYNINQTTRGAPYQYDVDAQFGATQGTGTWVAKRICNFTFTKQ